MHRKQATPRRPSERDMRALAAREEKGRGPIMAAPFSRLCRLCGLFDLCDGDTPPRETRMERQRCLASEFVLCDMIVYYVTAGERDTNAKNAFLNSPGHNHPSPLPHSHTRVHIRTRSRGQQRRIDNTLDPRIHLQPQPPRCPPETGQMQSAGYRRS